jgi:tungstate transport system ATP-binding protein
VNMPAPDSHLPIVFESAQITAGRRTLLREVSLTIGPGPPCMLIGPNGAGKTTLLRAAMGLVPVSAGRISWGGKPVPARTGCAIVFQKPAMFRRSVLGNVLFALDVAGVPARQRGRQAAELLERVGLAGLAQQPARRLSGGEQQRLALARALARRPDVLFLDEPTASLDPQATDAIESIIRSLCAAGMKIVMSTHDLAEARRLAGEIVLLDRGAVVESGPAGPFFASPRSEGARRFLAGGLLI